MSALGRGGQFLGDVGRSLRETDTWVSLTAVQMRRIGVQSLPIALFIAVFAGIVLALLSSYSFTGAVPLYFVGTFVGKAMMLELAPVLVGLALAGRVGANIAAELGTMRVTEQVDALETLAFNPNAYLVVPRALAATAMFPVVVALATGLGIVAGWFTAINLLDLSSPDFVKGLRLFYQFKDVWFGLLKAMSFGFVIAMIGCYKGLNTRGGAEGVGRETTAAVVMGAEMILVLDAFWAVVLL
ncbi:MAG: ABC transporter permease [Gemmatimonadota bacterium]|nr:ABC transporter permease [Gemmatimonadota bacterium]MDH3368000.1 ABC transporter permease [Gemmatimonadota bacterium]MDH3479477.1 ABC transporter permease [Gemmatimonadota bacterium]MDH3570061.1 ABC transporter permease [Gemmatimonadota bacterium]MDH5550375.1 ABC transporter permease [Gemmatimonadota bacterium]